MCRLIPNQPVEMLQDWNYNLLCADKLVNLVCERLNQKSYWLINALILF